MSSSLMIAAFKNDHTTITQLVRTGVNVNLVEEIDYVCFEGQKRVRLTPLEYVCYAGAKKKTATLETVKCLIGLGAVTDRDANHNPLMYACLARNRVGNEIATYLVDNKLSEQSELSRGDTEGVLYRSLIDAIHGENLVIVRWILQKLGGRPKLHSVIHSGLRGVSVIVAFNIMTACGADINEVVDFRGCKTTPLDRVMAYSQFSWAKSELERRGARRFSN